MPYCHIQQKTQLFICTSLGEYYIDSLKRINEYFFNLVDSTTKCNFEQLGKEAKDVLVSKASRPPSQSSHDLSTP